MNVGKTATILSQMVKKAIPTLPEQPLRPQFHTISRCCATIFPQNSPKILRSPNVRSNFLKASKAQVSSPAAAAVPRGIMEEETITISRLCTIHDREKMINFMSELFVTREPLMRSLGATPQNSRKYIAYGIDVSCFVILRVIKPYYFTFLIIKCI